MLCDFQVLFLFLNDFKFIKSMDNFEEYANIKINEVCRLCLSKKEEMQLISDNGFKDTLFDCMFIEVNAYFKFINS